MPVTTKAKERKSRFVVTRSTPTEPFTWKDNPALLTTNDWRHKKYHQAQLAGFCKDLGKYTTSDYEDLRDHSKMVANLRTKDSKRSTVLTVTKVGYPPTTGNWQLELYVSDTAPDDYMLRMYPEPSKSGQSGTRAKRSNGK